MVNLTYPELAETKVADLPPASLDTLKQMREDACSSTSFAFKLQPQQRFLRRVLSPDAPTQNILLVHGTGVGKTCSAIQVAEEYILRPEFQDKKVLVLANPSIQENFKNQIFDVSRVNVDVDGLLTSKQCTGRRYLDILQRGQHQPLKVSSREQQETLMSRAVKIINEFYEFQGYGEFANILEKQKIHNTPADVKTWIHATFDNRLLVVDEAHNLRETTETNVDAKLISAALKQIIQVANGITLVLLTATPMYDRFEEVFDYLNLFLWNARRQAPSESIHAADFFTDEGDFISRETENEFRSLCQTYISFVKGENPFTFPFRLPPPDNILAKNDRTLDLNGNKITKKLKYLPLTQSIMSPFQARIVKDLKLRGLSEHRTICTFPENKGLNEVLEKRDGQYFYTSEPFLAPSKVATYSSKFALIADILDNSTGVVFVYSNLAELGVQLFAMCLEEHGYTSAMGNALLGETSNEVKKGSKGKYALITSQNSDTEINRILTRVRRRENVNGEDIRVILASPKVSEGVDFRYVRQIHILDPWFNMSRIEQVIGRGMRVCSHSLLPFEEQNTTIYLHVCRYADKKQETLDEYIYRAIVEQKGIAIAKVKKNIMESAMDCSLEIAVNSLPADWKNLKVPQIRNQDGLELQLPIQAMSSPAFIEDTTLECNVEESEEDPNHVRPLSAILDVRDEILDKILAMILRKPIWTFKDLYASKEMKQYEPELVSYILQNVIESRVVLKDSYGRSGHLEAKKGLISFSIREDETLQEKILDPESSKPVPIRTEPEEEEEEEEEAEEKPVFDISKRLSEHKWPPFVSKFSDEVKEWYFVDNVLSHADKVKHMFSLNWSKPPIYAKPIKTPNLYIFSPEEIYNSKFEKITPIGAEKDEYDAWKKALKEKFLRQRDSYFGSLKIKDDDKKLVFNVDEKAIPVKKVERSKGIGGRTCIVYPPAILDSFMEWLGSRFPPEAKNRELKCVYLDMSIRSAVLDEKEGVVWYTPEEWTALDEMKKTLK
jgi:superfamily II DNA or RNA helicase